MADYDIIVVGGGAAGMTAALYALRAGKSVLVLEKEGFGGQIAQSPRVENFPGTAAMSGAEFSDRLLDQVTALGGEIDIRTVTGIEVCGSERVVKTDEGELTARAVILATGAKHRHMGIAREDELSGVSYCAVCDGAFYKGRPVAVYGGGDAALQDALLLSNYCSAVYVIHRRDEFRAEKPNVEALKGRSNVRFVLSRVITGLEGEGELRGVWIESPDGADKMLLPVDGLFVAIGFEPENAAFGNVAELDEGGWFASAEDCRTRTPGVYTAGDCRKKSVHQLTTAVGDGASAAVAACRYIDKASQSFAAGAAK